jgi:ADP-ribose pyrophosphatase YjhB (NUDIX family)
MSEIRVRTGVVVINEFGQLLLVPHYIGGEVLWYLPGGGVEFLERVEDAAVRE